MVITIHLRGRLPILVTFFKNGGVKASDLAFNYNNACDGVIIIVDASRCELSKPYSPEANAVEAINNSRRYSKIGGGFGFIQLQAYTR